MYIPHAMFALLVIVVILNWYKHRQIQRLSSEETLQAYESLEKREGH